MSSRLASVAAPTTSRDAAPAPSAVAPPAEAIPVISVRGVGKCYHVYDRPQDRLKQALLRWRRTYFREFWALRGVSFDVLRGESMGIVGRNGSGKSTLLQIIAGTLTPTEGEVLVGGRVAAMLELGSGFNPEFTGRENVFLKGAILGIPRREMEERFDAIAGFADIGAFIDLPLKTYSSGMGARLAFAVAFSIDPDVMIVDEILAVGDIGFQQRCLARLRQLRDNGLTLLFVSHSTEAVRSVCQRALLLADGAPAGLGPADRVTDLYLSHMQEETNREVLQHEAAMAEPVPFSTDVPGHTRYGTGHVQIESVDVLDRAGEPCRAFRFGEPITLAATIRSHIDAHDISVSFLLRDMTGVNLMGTTTYDEHVELPRLGPGERIRVRFQFDNQLRSGSFGVCLSVNRVSSRDYSDAILFDQVDGCVAFGVMGDPDRPVHYKFHQPVAVDWEVVRDG
jgi:lipopolysaccharide transport system ATP-binding protein